MPETATKSVGRQFAIWSVVALLLLAGAGAATFLDLLRARPKLFDRTPVPQPDRSDAAAIAIPASGVQVTIKQSDKAWLPGGQYQLHLDDITGRQVLASATDASGRVVFGPTSVKKGAIFAIPSAERPAMRVKVVRLENMLAGGDFGEFLILPAASTGDEVRD
jgi:hypothetical protein